MKILFLLTLIPSLSFAGIEVTGGGSGGSSAGSAVSGCAANEVLFMNSSGLLDCVADFIFDGTTLSAPEIEVTGTGPANFTAANSSMTFSVSGSVTPSYTIYTSSIVRTGGHAVIDSGRLTGTANQVVISSASLPIVNLSLPQSIGTASTPQFANLGLGVAANSGRGIYYTNTSLSMAAQKVGTYMDMRATTAGAGDLIGDFKIVSHNASGTSGGGVYGSLFDAYVQQGTVNGGMFGVWARTYSFAGTVGTTVGVDVFNNTDAGSTATTIYGVRVTPSIAGTNTNYYGLYVNTPPAGKHAMVLESGLVTINEDGVADSDFRVEGDTQANAIFVDASADAVGFATAAPVRPVHITGAMRLEPQASAPGSPSSGDIYVDSTATPDELCFYDGAAWQGISSGTDANCS